MLENTGATTECTGGLISSPFAIPTTTTLTTTPASAIASEGIVEIIFPESVVLVVVAVISVFISTFESSLWGVVASFTASLTESSPSVVSRSYGVLLLAIDLSFRIAGMVELR